MWWNEFVGKMYVYDDGEARKVICFWFFFGLHRVCVDLFLWLCEWYTARCVRVIVISDNVVALIEAAHAYLHTNTERGAVVGPVNWNDNTFVCAAN